MLRLVPPPIFSIGNSYAIWSFTLVLVEWGLRRVGGRSGRKKVCRGQFLEYLVFSTVGFEAYNCGEQSLEDFYIEFFHQIWALRKGLYKDWILNAFLKEGKFALFSGIHSSFFWAIKSCLDPCSYFLADIKYLRSCVRVIISYRVETMPVACEVCETTVWEPVTRWTDSLPFLYMEWSAYWNIQTSWGIWPFFFFLVLKAGCT